MLGITSEKKAFVHKFNIAVQDVAFPKIPSAMGCVCLSSAISACEVVTLRSSGQQCSQYLVVGYLESSIGRDSTFGL